MPVAVIGSSSRVIILPKLLVGSQTNKLMLPYASSCCRKYHASVAKPHHLSGPCSARLESLVCTSDITLPTTKPTTGMRRFTNSQSSLAQQLGAALGINHTLGCWKSEAYCSKQVAAEDTRDQQHPDELIGAILIQHG